MPPTNTTTQPSPTAAARVFAIPELLEHILLTLAHESIQTGRDSNIYYLEPITTLSRCQAVNQDFNGTIAGSRKLHKLMEAANPGAHGESDGVEELENALNWLFRHEHNLGPFFTRDDENDIFVNGSPSF